MQKCTCSWGRSKLSDEAKEEVRNNYGSRLPNQSITPSSFVPSNSCQIDGAAENEVRREESVLSLFPVQNLRFPSSSFEVLVNALAGRKKSCQCRHLLQCLGTWLGTVRMPESRPFCGGSLLAAGPDLKYT